MSFFILWKNNFSNIQERQNHIESVCRSIQEQYQQFLYQADAPKIYTTESCNGLIWFAKPQGFNCAFHESTATKDCFALHFPINLKELFQGNFPLSQCCEQLEKSPESVIKNLMPMFALFWQNHQDKNCYLQTDGLGAAPIYLHQEKDFFAITNKAFSLESLGIKLRPDLNQWAFKFCYKYMPKNCTGFKNLQKLGPGERIRIGKEGVSIASFDCRKESYFKDQHLSINDSLESAYDALDRAIDCLTTLSSVPVNMPLTGGFDTRACASLILKQKKNANFYIIAKENSLDTILAKKLADSVGVTLKYTDSKERIPPKDLATILSNAHDSLTWRDCLEDYYQLKYMGPLYKADDHSGPVLISGKSGEVGRFRVGKKYPFLSRDRDGQKLFNDELSNLMMQKYTKREGFRLLKHWTNPQICEYIEDTARDLVNESMQNGDTTYQVGLYHYLNNDERNFRIGTYARNISIKGSPFIHPDFVSATFSLGRHQIPDFDMIHRHVAHTACPSWKDIPYVMDSVPFDEYMRLKTNCGFNNQEFWDDFNKSEIAKLTNKTLEEFFSKKPNGEEASLCDLSLLLTVLDQRSREA